MVRQFVNAPVSIVSTPSLITTLARLLHSKNAPLPIVLTFPGIVMLVRLVQLSNASSPMLVTVLPISTDVALPILVMLLYAN